MPLKPSILFSEVLVFGVLMLCSPLALSMQENRLAKESSPYLLQHAKNPVDWYPWGDEALKRAREEKKMIFLSIGYAACHWCHVMERESFEDVEIAAFLNKHFVCIKVDREERPDIDQIYMTAVQLMTGRGGWPMTVLMTSDAKPIFGGSYFPARDGDRGNHPGFLTIVRKATQLWAEEREELQLQSERVVDAVKQAMAASESIPESAEIDIDSCNHLLHQTQQKLASSFDPEFGGFGFVESNPNKPKFPEPSNLIFLLERSKRESLDAEVREDAKKMLVKTLDGMIAGGIYDHLGGGFHRYSVDRYWRIPHFEKMLYDNAQLVQLYALAFEATGRVEYKSVVESTCDFVIRELGAPDGAFFASLDADSEGEEGKFYRWEQGELQSIASKVKGYKLFAKTYGFDTEPNFDGKFYAPQPRTTLTQVAIESSQSFESLASTLSDARVALFEIRSKRTRPPTDVKVLTSWNGLMIAGLADAGRILQRPDYIQSAANATKFLLRELKTDDGRLLRSYALGESKLPGYLDDYAFLVHGLLRLHRATGDAHWLQEAIELTKKELQFFSDDATGGLFYTSTDHTKLMVRFQDPVDGVLPSGNSVTASNLLTLTYDAHLSEFQKPLRRLLLSSLTLIGKNPRAASLMSSQIGNWLDRKSE